MIRVTVELVPFGVGEPVQLGRMEIWNDMEASSRSGGSRGSYGWRVWGKRSGRPLRASEDSTRVVDFPRRSLSAWHLVARCLKQAGYR